MTDNDITTICGKIESLHDKIIKSKFSEMVTESEMICLILAVQELNRQKAEIERLNKQLGELKFLESRVKNIKNTPKDTFSGALISIAEGVARYEAIEEFAERLRKSSSYSVVADGDREIPSTRWYSISESNIDNLIKEMVGEG